MGKEIEPSKDADKKKVEDAAAKEEPRPPPTVHEQFRANIALLEKAVKAKETRLLVGRLLRQTALFRKQLTPALLQSFIKETIPAQSATSSNLLAALEKAPASMDTDSADATAQEQPASSTEATEEPLPEVEAYVNLLMIMFLVDKKQDDVMKELTQGAVKWLSSFNRRTLDGLAARIYFYYSLAYERAGTLSDIRSSLLALHRTAVLRHDEYGQETLLNLLLRNYLHYNLYDQAEKLRAKAQRPEVSRSNQQLCRYLFYLGRIRAIQLEYTDAKDCLQQAARKAPSVALGFRVVVNKWLALVRLLLGEIPEYLDFQQPGLQVPLQPYFELTQAVRRGDLTAFRAVAAQHEAVWAADRTHNLITRLRQNVIRAGLRRINLAYSRISLADVATKLGLPSVEDTECIVAKAIRDGGVDAVINHAEGYMQSREIVNAYNTDEPQAAFHDRIAFCLDIHNEAVKAMRFEADAHKRKPGTKDRKLTEEEIVASLEEDGDDF